jgi:hypothetical protein
MKGEGKPMVGGPELELSGLDLQTGEGMRSYYDKIVPKRLQELIKKHDPEARVGAHEIPNTGEKRRQGHADVGEIMNWHPSYTNLSRQEQSAQWNAMSPVNRRQLIKDYESSQSGDITGHGIDITPAMRESILRGQSAHARGGEVEGYGDGGIIKKALQAVGGAFKPTETGWVFKDVKNPNLTPAQNKAISHAIDAGRYVEAELPIRSMYATQPHVNADFATPVSSNRGNLPVVQRIGDEFYVRDGHHRLTKLATEGAETAKVNLVDPWERTPTEMPLLDWKPKTPEQMASEQALAQKQKQENDALYNDLMSSGFGDIEPQGRAKGGAIEDHALAAIYNHC